MLNVLITGNMGYVGSVLVPKLYERNMYNIVGYDIGYFGHNLSTVGLLPECYLGRQIFKDIRNITISDVEGIDVVVHLAALSNDPIGNSFSQLTKEINLDASKKLVQLCKSSSVKRFIFASSCSVYGAAGTAQKTENSPVDPLTAYAKSKIDFEGYLQDEVSDQFQALSLRFATACGPSPRLRIDLVLNDFVLNAISNKVINVLSDGTPIRPLVDVRDMANAIDWAMSAKLSEKFTSVNVGKLNSNYTVLNIAKAVSQHFDFCDLKIATDAQPDKRSYSVDFSKFDKLTNGKVLKYDLEASIEGLVQQLTNPDNMHYPYYKRLKVLEDEIARKNLTKNLELYNVV